LRSPSVSTATATATAAEIGSGGVQRQHVLVPDGGDASMLALDLESAKQQQQQHYHQFEKECTSTMAFSSKEEGSVGGVMRRRKEWIGARLVGRKWLLSPLDVGFLGLVSFIFGVTRFARMSYAFQSRGQTIRVLCLLVKFWFGNLCLLVGFFFFFAYTIDWKYLQLGTQRRFGEPFDSKYMDLKGMDGMLPVYESLLSFITILYIYIYIYYYIISRSKRHTTSCHSFYPSLGS
jgi:hypothetical protein